MTQNQFKEGLLRGQGRCIKAAQVDPHKYYRLILWACSHELSFDAQCEGTRSWFAYQLVSCYQDKSPFLDVAIQSIKRAKHNSGWKMLYLAELLYYFSRDGYGAATQALWSKYEKLYANLIARKRRPNGIFYEQDDFAMLCEVLAKKRTLL